jgi:hypothetical protein
MMSSYDVSLVATNLSFRPLSKFDSDWIKHEFNILVCKDNEKEVVAGRLLVYKLNVGNVIRQNCSLFDAFDCFSQEAYDCYVKVFDDKEEVRKAFQDERCGLYDVLTDDFHLLSMIEIDEAFKGNSLAGIAIQIYLENFANGSDVAYFKAFPLQHGVANGESYKRTFRGGLKTCEVKLCEYYQRLGFRRIGKTSDFFFVVDDFLDKWQKVKFGLAID